MAASQGHWAPERVDQESTVFLENRSQDPSPLSPTHTHRHTKPWYTLFLVCFPVLHSSPLHRCAHTHTRALPAACTPRVNIISFSDRWEGSDLVENEATNLHPYYTVIHTHLQTCIALSCTLLPRMTLTHFLSLHVKRDGWRRHSLFKRSNLQRRVI